MSINNESDRGNGINDKNRSLKFLKFVIMIIMLLDFIISYKYELYFRRVAFVSALVVGGIIYFLHKVNIINLDGVLDKLIEEKIKNGDSDDLFNKRLLLLLIISILLIFIICYVFGFGKSVYGKLTIILVTIISLIYGIIYLIK